MAFLVLNGKTQRQLIPSVDYNKFILDIHQITTSAVDNDALR